LLKNILIVCVGNICRSPMAEGLFKHALTEVNKVDYFVSSAGLGALVGHQPDPIACQLLLKRGIDISDYRACQLNREMIRKSELILVMDLNQKIAIEENELSARGKVFRLGEWGKFDIDDPYKQDLSVFEESLALIEKGVSEWVAKLS